jgi:hypothetical protein
MGLLPLYFHPEEVGVYFRKKDAMQYSKTRKIEEGNFRALFINLFIYLFGLGGGGWRARVFEMPSGLWWMIWRISE